MADEVFEPQASQAAEAAWFFGRLFAGIYLDHATRVLAQGIVAKSIEQMRLVKPAPAPGVWDRWDEAMASYAERDRELASLLTDAAQRTFERNAAAVRAHFDLLRARASRP